VMKRVCKGASWLALCKISLKVHNESIL
jgi:hypothetical protein